MLYLKPNSPIVEIGLDYSYSNINRFGFSLRDWLYVGDEGSYSVFQWKCSSSVLLWVKSSDIEKR